MKKIIAILLCLVLLGCSAAVAETAEKESLGVVSVNGTFSIKCRMIESYRISITDKDDIGLKANITSEDPTKPVIQLSVAFNDSYTDNGSGLRLNDISEEDMAEIKESFEEQATVYDFLEAETAHGTKLLIVKGAVGERNFVDFYSIYNSYEIEVIAYAGAEAENTELTDEQIQTIIDFLSDMDFETV